MKKKVLLIVIPIILIIVIAATVVIGLFLRDKDEDKKEEVSTGSKWGDTYYAYLKDAVNEDDDSKLESDYGFDKEMEDGKLQFCSVENDENPAMVISYKKSGVTKVNSYGINASGDVIHKKYGDNSELRYVYNVEKGTYSWYVRVKTDNGWMYYPLDNSSEALPSGVEVKDEETKVKAEDGSELSITELDKTFIEPEITPVKAVDFSLDMKEKDLANNLKETVEDYQNNAELVSAEEKENVTKKVEEVKEKAKTIEEIKEKASSITGTWVLNTNVVSSDPMANNLSRLFGSGLSMSTNELKLNEDGTFSFYVGIAYNTTGKYKFENNQVTVYDVKDPEVANAESLKNRAEKMKFDYIEYKGHKFLRFFLYEFSDSFDAYIFFERDPSNGSDGYADDEVPPLNYKASSSSSSTTNSNTSSSSSSTASTGTIKAGSYSLKYGKYTCPERGYYMGEVDGVVQFDVYSETYVIKDDGTYTYEKINKDNGETENESGTYKVEYNSNIKSYVIIFSNSGTYGISKNDSFSVVAGEGSIFNWTK